MSVANISSGIKAEYLQQIIEPFRRMDQRYGGSRLNLNIFLGIVQLHHGRFELDNRAEVSLEADW